MESPQLSANPPQSWLPWTVACHSEATWSKASRAWALDTWSLAFCRDACQASIQRLHQEPYFWSQSYFYLRIPWNTSHACWCTLTEYSKICSRDKTLYPVWNNNIYHFFREVREILTHWKRPGLTHLTKYLIQHLKTPPPSLHSLAKSLCSCFWQSRWQCSTSYSYGKQRINFPIFINIKSFLSSVTTVIASILHQVREKTLRFLHEIHRLLGHFIIDSNKVPPAFFLHKTARCWSSVPTVEQLSNLQKPSQVI